MSILRHLFVALLYTLIATSVAVVLPALVPAIGMPVALIAGAIVLIGFGLMHESFARQDDQRRLADELHDLRAAHSDVMRELTDARREVAGVLEALMNSRKAKAGVDLREDIDKVAAEVELLQNLFNGLGSMPRAGSEVAAGGTPDLAVLEIAGGSGSSISLPASTDEPLFLGAEHSLAPGDGGLDDEAILAIIRDGLQRDRVDLVLQPIVSLPQRKRQFFEAFTRIRAQDDEIIVPDQYIAIAEREGLITAIDNMLLFRCVQLLRRSQSKNQNIGYFCNISPYTLADHDFFGEFVHFMSENAELAPNLIFEFAQSTVADRDEDIERQLGRLAGMGFRFSMDQVASLSLDYDALAERRFKFVKIDARTLIQEFDAPSSRLDIDVVDLKRTLERHGIDLIVEKIESEPMLLDVLDLHVDYGQGYLFGEPKVGAEA
jgi:cyclic-di-GMP phosphodiesterase TipF (flagellum assembly factor)